MNGGLAKVPAVTLGFWIIKILCTTLGATAGDFFDKPSAQGGLEFSRPLAAVVRALAASMVLAATGVARAPAGGPRAAALQTFEALGRIAAKRLD